MARGTRMVNIYMSFYVLLTMLVSFVIMPYKSYKHFIYRSLHKSAILYSENRYIIPCKSYIFHTYIFEKGSPFQCKSFLI
jgi:hypothetical protein